jgi:polar amino acid transport system permease protein
VQIFIVYFGLSSLGLKLSAEVSAVIALVVNMGAYTTEIMRAGIQSIHHTQLEAADCLGLTRVQTILHVVLLPAIERVYPALSSQFRTSHAGIVDHLANLGRGAAVATMCSPIRIAV